MTKRVFNKASIRKTQRKRDENSQPKNKVGA